MSLKRLNKIIQLKKNNNINTTDTRDLVQKSDYNTNISVIENETNDHDHAKYNISQEFNKITSENFTTRLVQANSASTNDSVNFIKKTDLDDKMKKFK